MKVVIGYPPLESERGVPLLSQNRQFQWFHEPTYVYPCIAHAGLCGVQKGEQMMEWLGRQGGCVELIIAFFWSTPRALGHKAVLSRVADAPDGETLSK